MHCQPPAGGRREPLGVQWALTSLQLSLTLSQNSPGWWVRGFLRAELQHTYKIHSQKEKWHHFHNHFC